MKKFQEMYGDNIVIKKNGFKFKKGYNPFKQQSLDFVV